MFMYHYVYYSYEEWGRGYIGVRECECLPEEDSQYMGSFYDKSFHPSNKIILEIFETRQQALAGEIALHAYYDVKNNPHFANQANQTCTSFDYSGGHAGKIHNQESKDKIRLKITGLKRSSETRAKMRANAMKTQSWLNLNSKYQCTVTGHISNASGLAQYQKKRGIDPTNRIRLSEHEQPYNKTETNQKS